MKRTRGSGKKGPRANMMAKAISRFLVAAGLDTNDENLKDTPRRVAEAFAEEFLDGYSKDPAEILSEQFPVSKRSDRELVVITKLHFRSMCPHHLLPYSGLAHIAYVPGKSVIGFGRIGALLDVYAHRLVLQEELARNVATALTTHLKTQGAACVIEAEQTCLRLRGGEQHQAVTHTEAYEGVLKDSELRAELWARIR